MDPNETLDQIRALLREGTLDPAAAGSLARLMSSLDNWLSKGGFAPTAWTATPCSGLEGTIGLVWADQLRTGDIFLFPAREIWGIEEDGFSIVVDDGQHTEYLDAGQRFLAFRPKYPISRRLDGCPDCEAGPGQRCHFTCMTFTTVDENARTYLARIGLIDLD
ncbi:hypothetical protein FB566_0885 [Stackebrandtia endophytica]|uniref:Uncharacterized protein n=1 Tax=Stackebrandtia endophytica TaxID=1496996 RepID=A0A543AS32_9ACTN|nr:hypothetical protein [Stackebrandtia endophytica]TQL75384.1 hypothetical protein FB566_0885 [Stackebrandtia endophytica]